MKRRNGTLLLFLPVILIFSTISSAAIFVGLLISGARADPENFIVQREGPRSIALNQYDANVYVVNLHDHTLSVISGQTETVIGNHAMGGKYPAEITFSSLSSRNTYVVNLHDNTLSIISGQTETVIGNPLFVINGQGGTTFGFSNSGSYNAATNHKLLLSGTTSVKASSNLAVKTMSPSTLHTRAITNSTSKVITTPSHPPLVP